jgi:DNA repair protein RecN (Recombination protein N)
MIVTGLGLLLGGRADPHMVRTGAERAKVEGRFGRVAEGVAARVEQAGGELDEGDLLVVRTLAATGRSRTHVGGTQTPNGVCAEVVGELVTIHGQSEQQRLTSGDRQRELLDRWAGPALSAVLVEYREAYADWQRTTSELGRLRAEAEQRNRRIEVLRFGLGEIEKVDPQAGEDVALAAEAQRLQAADDLRAAAGEAMVGLAGGEDEAGGALAGLVQARRALETAARRDPTAAELVARCQEISALTSDLAGELAGYLADLEADPGRLEQIAARRAALATVTRTYGGSVDAALQWAERAAHELDELAASEDRIEELTERQTDLETRLDALAERLTAGRQAAAAELRERVHVELTSLAMPAAQLSFTLQTGERGPYGRDRVDLLFSANPGSDPRPLGRVASGGELSRVRLALEVVLADQEAGGTLVFDEVDAGVGGKVAVEIGRRLAALARHRQVLVVTHLAQVAAFADRHYLVVKSDDGRVTTSGVVQVEDSVRAAELARMMAGLETTESALSHARELLAAARPAS